MSEAILGFSGKYRFMSNFSASEVELDGLGYPTVEHAYQAAKTSDATERRRIREADSPSKAKKLGQQVKLRADWEEVKLQIMEDLLIQKFSDPALKQKLLDTGEAYLEETNTWGDKFWGVCKGNGKNHLGKILMKIRKSLGE
jgi:hypothetical protein